VHRAGHVTASVFSGKVGCYKIEEEEEEDRR
jgi:hypothetical protein